MVCMYNNQYDTTIIKSMGKVNFSLLSSTNREQIAATGFLQTVFPQVFPRSQKIYIFCSQYAFLIL